MSDIELEEGRPERMVVRQVAVDFGQENGHWNSSAPDIFHIVNSASLAMPYLESDLIRIMRAARPLSKTKTCKATRSSMLNRKRLTTSGIGASAILLGEKIMSASTI